MQFEAETPPGKETLDVRKRSPPLPVAETLDSRNGSTFAAVFHEVSDFAQAASFG